MKASTAINEIATATRNVDTVATIRTISRKVAETVAAFENCGSRVSSKGRAGDRGETGANGHNLTPQLHGA